MKTNGATWKAYLGSWPDGQWFDDSNETIDGKERDAFGSDESIPDAAVVEFSCGVVFPNQRECEGVNLTSHFRAWQKAQTHATVVCSVPKDRIEEFDALIKTFGARATA